jgi:hypothetical protein
VRDGTHSAHSLGPRTLSGLPFVATAVAAIRFGDDEREFRAQLRN